MKYDPTILESSNISNKPSDHGKVDATIREKGILSNGTDPGATVLEKDGHDQPAGVINLAPGVDFLAYRLDNPLKVISAEADLWFVTHRETGERAVLKLYRFGIKPKVEITEAIKRLRREHIVEVFETGEKDGRHYEIQEYMAHGSLSEFINSGRASEAKVREILKELSDSITHLHQAKILHRDIKPSNILIRSLEPLDLVLTDFGISSMTELSLHMTTASRTTSYCAPEVFGNVVHERSDWWGVGIILIELLAGKHPFSDLNEKTIIYQYMVKAQPVPIPSEISQDWQRVIKGLLTRDPEKRWGSKEVQAWFSGEPNIPVYYGEESRIEIEARKFTHKSYKFNSKEYYEPSDLAVALAQNWGDAVKAFGRGMVTDWVKGQISDQEMADLLIDVAEDNKLDADQKLSVALLILNRNSSFPLLCKGEIVSADGILQSLDIDIAIKFLKSSVPCWLTKLRNDPWLEDLRDKRSAIIKKLDKCGVEFDENMAEILILTPSQNVQERALEERSKFYRSQVDVLRKIIEKPSLNDVDAILVLACDPMLFTTKEQEWQKWIMQQRTGLESLRKDIQKTPATLASLQNLEHRINYFEGQLASKEALEKSFGMPLPASANTAEFIELIKGYRTVVDTRLLEHRRHTQSVSMAQAGQITTVRSVIKTEAYIFGDIDYEAIAKAVGKWFIPRNSIRIKLIQIERSLSSGKTLSQKQKGYDVLCEQLKSISTELAGHRKNAMIYRGSELEFETNQWIGQLEQKVSELKVALAGHGKFLAESAEKRIQKLRKASIVTVIVLILSGITVAHIVFDLRAVCYGVYCAMRHDPQLYLANGRNYCALGKYEEAAAAYSSAIKINPAIADAYRLRGEAYYHLMAHGKQLDFARVLSDANEAIRLDPKNADAYAVRGLVYRLQNDSAQAMADFNKALGITSVCGNALRGRGTLYYAQKDYAKALADINEAVRINPADMYAYSLRGDCRRMKDDFYTAVSDYTKAVELDPKFAAAYYGRGRAYIAKEDPDKAISDFDKALKFGSKTALVYYSRALPYAMKHDYNKAIDDYNQAIRLEPNFVGAYFNRGLVYRIKNDNDRAIEDFTQAIKIDPSFNKLYHNRADLYLEQGKLDQAISDYTNAIKGDSRNADAYCGRADAYKRQDKLDQAISDYGEARRLNGNLADAKYSRSYADAYYTRGNESLIRNNFDLAISDYTAALNIEPKNAGIYRSRGDVYFRKNNFDFAISDYTAALNIYPNNGDVYCSRGNAYFQKKDFDKAIADYNMALKIKPGDELAYRNRSAAYQNQQRSKRGWFNR